MDGAVLVTMLMLTQTMGQKPAYIKDCYVSAWGAWSKCTEACDGGTQTRERRVIQERNGGKTCPSLSQTRTCNTYKCFQFKLRAATGNEIIYMVADKKQVKYELTKGWNTFEVSTRKVIVKFINAKKNVYDQTNDDYGKNAITGFLWGYNYRVLYTDAQGNDFASVGVAGDGPEYVSSQGGFKCGTADELSMCQTVRNMKWNWVGSYVFKFPILTSAPTTSPTPSPTPYPTPVPTPSPIAALGTTLCADKTWDFGAGCVGVEEFQIIKECTNNYEDSTDTFNTPLTKDECKAFASAYRARWKDVSGGQKYRNPTFGGEMDKRNVPFGCLRSTDENIYYWNVNETNKWLSSDFKLVCREADAEN